MGLAELDQTRPGSDTFRGSGREVYKITPIGSGRVGAGDVHTLLVGGRIRGSNPRASRAIAKNVSCEIGFGEKTARLGA